MTFQLVSCVLFCHIIGFEALVPVVEVDVLKSLYSSTDGDKWLWKNTTQYGPKWNFTTPFSNPCDENGQIWQGVVCTSVTSNCTVEECHIKALSLESYGLVGTIPSDIGCLSALSTLDLSSNYLYGSVPLTIGDLKQLKEILLQKNSLCSTVPPQLGDLSELQTLYLFENRLHGQLPLTLGNITALRSLYLYDNDITGPIPLTLGSCTALYRLSLASNCLTQSLPSGLAALRGLFYLSLGENYLSESIPSWIGSLTGLRSLVLQDNMFTSALPTQIGLLTGLRYLYAYYNELTGPLPSAIGHLKELRELDISYNKLSQSLPSELGNMASVGVIQLQYNCLSSTIPSALVNCTELNSLFLNNNFLDGQFPSALCRLSLLESLYLDENYLTGSLPTDLGDMSSLREISLADNMLSGPLTASLGRLSWLKVLDLSSNFFTATIPQEFGDMTGLLRMILDSNDLSGSLPFSLCQLSKLEYLFFYFNNMNSTLPMELGKMTGLLSLSGHHNQLSGVIPTQIESLTRLGTLYMYNNNLHGSIPFQLGSLASMSYLSLDDNAISGPLPAELGNMSKLLYLSMRFNRITNSIPPELGRLTRLTGLLLAENLLSYAIPAELGNLARVTSLSLYGNYLTGPLPTQVGNMRAMVDMNLANNLLDGQLPVEVSNLLLLNFMILDNNHFTGHVPPWIGEFPVLRYIYLNRNSLSGAIPTVIGKMMGLSLLYLQDNYLSQPVPREVGNLTELDSLQLQNNKLTGTLPPELGSLTALKVLQLQYNGFSGRIPCSLASLKSLQQLYLQGNHLTGHSKCVFDNAASMNVINLDMSDNRLSGDIPKELFTMPFLETCALTSNCFSGRLPHTICQATRVVDGLGAAEHCRHTTAIPFTAVQLGHVLTGSIPDCLWGLRNLSVVHLSGNGLTGTIGQVPPGDTSLINISLSHNHLSGTIPRGIREGQFSTLDMSFNKLSGEFSGADYKAVKNGNMSLTLEVNRLSGRLSSAVETVRKLQILKGNIFSCAFVPDKDEYSSSYVCGSSALDGSLYALLTVGVWALTVVLIYPWLCKRVVRARAPAMTSKRLHERAAVFWTQCIHFVSSKAVADQLFRYGLADIFHFDQSLQWTLRTDCVIILIGIIGCLPIYVFKVMESGGHSVEYSTHSHLYNWVLSTAYVSGIAPAVVLMITWIAVIFFVTARVVFLRYNPCIGAGGSLCPAPDEYQQHQNNSTDDVAKDWKDGWIGAKIAGVLFVNASIVISFNGLYVYSTLFDFRTTTKIAIQLALAATKYLYSFVLVPAFILSPVKELHSMLWIKVSVLLFNAVFVPCLVTAVTEPLCYQGLFVQPAKVQSMYSFVQCDSALIIDETIVCESPVTMNVDVAPFYPPFSYSGQCTSVLLESYIPVFIYMFCFQIASSIIWLALVHLTDFDKLPSWTHPMLDGVCWPKQWAEATRGNVHTGITGEELTYNGTAVVSSERNEATTSLPLQRSMKQRTPVGILNVKNILAKNAHALALSISFGLCCPYLAIAIALSLYVSTLQLRYLIGRFLLNRIRANITLEDNCTLQLSSYPKHLAEAFSWSHDSAIMKLNTAVRDINGLLESILWPLIMSSTLFISVVCFDMAADEKGWRATFWIPSTIASTTLILWTSINFYRHMMAGKVTGERKVIVVGADGSRSTIIKASALGITANPIVENEFTDDHSAL